MPLSGGVAWNLGVEHVAVLYGAHRKTLMRVIGFHHQQPTDHRMLCAKTLKNAQSEMVETVIQNRSHFCIWRTSKGNPEQLFSLMMLGMMSGRRPGTGSARAVPTAISKAKAYLSCI